MNTFPYECSYNWSYCLWYYQFDQIDCKICSFGGGKKKYKSHLEESEDSEDNDFRSDNINDESDDDNKEYITK